ncbi:unnamed protein product [Polarella glacialis]|uniref:EF-hand domain-containing protein n=1 Tax=Polarella glacialis TaxID=89957 RepID=A0A813LT36_POLGL|nr:unnamed protein product [Polarella glacialis]CAE8737892.1 unnamed protein product [Polarella glacialis]
MLGNGEGHVNYKRFIEWMHNEKSTMYFLYTHEEQSEMEALEMDTSSLEAVLAKAKERFEALDKNGNGVLEGRELTELCSWVFSEFGRFFKSKEDKEYHVKKQVDRFERSADATGVWTFETFAAYYRTVLADSEKFQLKRAEAFKKGYDKSAAAQKFRELDVDASGVLEGKEILVFAEWVFSSFRPEGQPLTDALIKVEAQKLIDRIDGKRGNSDGKLSFTEVDLFIAEKIQQIETFKKNISARG